MGERKGKQPRDCLLVLSHAPVLALLTCPAFSKRHASIVDINTPAGTHLLSIHHCCRGCLGSCCQDFLAQFLIPCQVKQARYIPPSPSPRRARAPSLPLPKLIPASFLPKNHIHPKFTKANPPFLRSLLLGHPSRKRGGCWSSGETSKTAHPPTHSTSGRSSAGWPWRKAGRKSTGSASGFTSRLRETTALPSWNPSSPLCSQVA